MTTTKDPDPTPPATPLPSDAGLFTIEAARTEFDRQAAEHEQLAAEHKRPIAVELGKKQRADLEAQLHADAGRDTGPLVTLLGLQVIPVDDEDKVALVYSGVAGA